MPGAQNLSLDNLIVPRETHEEIVLSRAIGVWRGEEYVGGFFCIDLTISVKSLSRLIGYRGTSLMNHKKTPPP